MGTLLAVSTLFALRPRATHSYVMVTEVAVPSGALARVIRS
jgi:hypothetical protein